MSALLEANKENLHGTHKKNTAKSKEGVVSATYPNPRDPDFNCQICKIKFKDQPSFLTHLQQKHESQFKVPQMVSRGLICRVCFFKFKSKARYRRHLVKTHNVKTSKIVEQQPKTAPNPSYPNTYCNFCEVDILKHDRYRQHLEGLHDIKYEVPDELDSVIRPLYRPDPHDPDFYCLECEISLDSKLLYAEHLSIYHKMCTRLGKISFVHNSRNMDYDKDFPFDIKDPDNVKCDDCDQEYETPKRYRQHLKLQHHMHLFLSPSKLTPYEIWTTLRNYKSPPDPNDKKFHCSVCNIEYQTRDEYHCHIKEVHYLQVVRAIKSESSPVCFKSLDKSSHINNSDFECETCDKKLDTRSLYHEHLNTSHGDVISSNLSCCFSDCNNLRDDIDNAGNPACLACTNKKRSNQIPAKYSVTPLLKIKETYNRREGQKTPVRKLPKLCHITSSIYLEEQENDTGESEEDYDEHLHPWHTKRRKRYID